MSAIYRWLADPGHAWLEVPMEEVKRSGAAISRYSYRSRDGRIAYLKEDCDAPAFLDTVPGIRADLFTVLHISGSTSNPGRAWIRNLPRFGD